MAKPDYDTGLVIKRKQTKTRKPYDKKIPDKRGQKGREPHAIRSFWIDNSMEEVLNMTDEQLMQAIDKSLEIYIERQIKNNKDWNFPDMRMNLDK